MRKRQRRSVLAGLVIGWLMLGAAGCIRPAEETTPTAAAVAAPLPTDAGQAPPAAAPTQPGDTAAPAPAGFPQIEQFIRDRGHTPAQLTVWGEQPRDPDRLQGFSYQAEQGQPCAGFLLTSVVNGVWQPTYGAQICAPDAGAQALAGVTFFPTSPGDVYTIVFGRVTDPAVTAIAVVFDDGTNQTINPSQGGFMLVRPGVSSVSVITAIDNLGNTVIDNIPQTPV